MDCSFGFYSLCKYCKITFSLLSITLMPIFIKLLQYRPNYNLFCLKKFSIIKLKSYYFLQHSMSLASRGKKRQM